MKNPINHSVLDFEAPALLLNRFSKENGVTVAEANKQFQETKKFLFLCSTNNGVSFSPSKKIDRMWHEFILHTRAYQEFCGGLGVFVHHQPSDKPMPDSYENTLRGLKECFGFVDSNYWDRGVASAGDCSDCSSACDCCA